MKTLNEVLFKEGEPHFVSLSKLTGKTISDIEVTLASEYGPALQLFRVHFTDGTKCFVEGEHDYPYLDSMLGVTDEQFEALREEQNK